jgi:putative nucleotidyltransferase with HDIG domain
MMCKDGSTVWVEGKVSFLRDEEGRPVGIIGVARDISERVQTEEAMRQALWGAVKVAGKIAERRDPYTAGHQRRVAELACAIAGELGLPKDQVEGIQVAALLHDIGKVTVPSEILTKPGELSPMEFELIKTHAAVGADILEGIDFSWPVAKIVRQHHERLDGSGYPQGLKDDITKALKEIKKNKDVLYDPQVVEACVKLFEEGRFKFHRLNNKH